MSKVVLQPTIILHKEDFRSTADGYHLDVWDNMIIQDIPGFEDKRKIVEIEVKIISAFTE